MEEGVSVKGGIRKGGRSVGEGGDKEGRKELERGI